MPAATSFRKARRSGIGLSTHTSGGCRHWLEEIEVDGVGHRFVSGIVRMQVIARIVGGDELLRVAGIARHLVEIDDARRRPGGPNPLVDRDRFASPTSL